MKSKPIIVFVHPHFTIPGGAGKVALELGKRLSSKYRVIIIALRIDQQYIIDYPEIQFISLNGPITSSFKFWILFPYWKQKLFNTLDNIAKGKKLTIISSVFPANWLALPYKKHRKVKMLWYCHEPSAFIHITKWRQAINNPIKKVIAEVLSPFFSLIDKSIAQNADLLIANSKFGATLVTSVYKVNPVIVYPGTDTTMYQPIDYSKKRNRVVTISRLTKFKNINILIEAFSKLNKHNGYELTIIGDGEEKKNLERLAKKFNIENKVRIMSGLSNSELIKLCSESKIFVLCSKNEPFGIVPIEAMACGTPAIVDDSGGPKETVINQKTGLIINMSSNSLHRSLEQLLKNDKKLKEMSMNARKHSLYFDWNKSVESLINYLQEP